MVAEKRFWAVGYVQGRTGHWPRVADEAAFPADIQVDWRAYTKGKGNCGLQYTLGG